MSEVLSSEQYRELGKRSSHRAHNPKIESSNLSLATSLSRPKPKPQEAGGLGIAHRLGGKGEVKAPREESIHIQLCAYVRAKYPNAIFTSESSGIRLTMGQAVKAKKLRSSSKLPDFWLAEPRGIFCGLFLELKRSKDDIFRKDGSYKQEAHIQGQLAVINRLIEKGYCASFAGGLSYAILQVDYYMSLPIPIR